MKLFEMFAILVVFVLFTGCSQPYSPSKSDLSVPPIYGELP